MLLDYWGGTVECPFQAGLTSTGAKEPDRMSISLRARILAGMFLIGAFAVLSQILFLREMLVAFFGSEPVIATMLASWLVGIGVGAFSTRLIVRMLPSVPSKLWWMLLSFLVLAVALPFQVYAIRIVRSIIGVPVGEYASFGAIFVSGVVLFVPTCWCIGCMFPVACAVLAQGSDDCDESPSGLVYAAEALGSMVLGLLMTFVLLPRISPYMVVSVGVAIALAGACAVAPRRRFAFLAGGVAALVVLLTVLWPVAFERLERGAIEARWRAFGVIGKDGANGMGRLRAVRDTAYQNLAVVELDGQFALYANGQVACVFPDEISYEDSVHFVMAQNPAASNVLLIGGNPVGDIPELLKYRIQKVICVALDAGIREIIRETLPERFDHVQSDSRVEFVSEDAPHYVKRCGLKFDVVLVHAPDPTTASANRFYTKEFYSDLASILTPGGFVYTEVSSSECLRSVAADLVASVYVTLEEVFGVVLVTAESRNRLFAAMDESSGITFDRQTLRDRSVSAQLTNEFFSPEYFLYRDEIDPVRVAKVVRRLREVGAPVNTVASPMTYYYGILLWSRISDSGIGKLLSGRMMVPGRDIVLACLILGGVCLVVGLSVRRGATVSAPARIWARMMVGLTVAATGFCGMALEILLIFVFQGLYGYVYAKIGTIVAAFMFGLVAGAWSGRALLRFGKRWLVGGMLIAQIIILAIAVVLPLSVGVLSSFPSELSWLAELAIHGAIVLLGCGVGATFPLANRLYRDFGGSVDAAAAITDASDHFGAAIGGLLTGVLLVPIYGIGGASLIIGAVVLLGLLCLLSAVAVGWRTEGIR